ncbi:hypothetical protein QQ054_25360 [Oscillatoria amoena NRMC-F 0135]|nr:hypothetical protein [Oscillatoria amoena NRMC-F 0135]
MVDAGLYITYVLFVGAVAMAVVLPIVSSFKTKGGLLKSVYGIGAFVILFGISYALTGSEVTQSQAAIGVTETVSKLVGAGLTMFYIVAALAVAGLIYSEINKATK